MLHYLSRHKTDLLVLAFLLAIAGLSHGYNMFHFPYYENDEGTYISQAWSFLTQGRLAPYTYWYDHAPGGWIFIALWSLVSGGFFAFGPSTNSGRVLMLVLHLVNTLLVYFIVIRLSRSTWAAVIANIIFSLSPLAIYFQRRVLLDNIMIFWVFVSLALLLKSSLRLSHIILSALVFGIAILTKENAVFFVPVFIYLIFTKSHPHHRAFALINWLTIVGIITSLYFLYALLKGELFPVGFLGDHRPHVSLLETLKNQYSRGENLPFWHPQSDFRISWRHWSDRDHYTLYLGALVTFINLLLSIKYTMFRIPAFLAVSFWLFLIRGKLVIDFYLIPQVPLLAINIALLIHFLLQKLSGRHKWLYHTFFLMVFIVVSTILFSKSSEQYLRDETTSQAHTINWIKQHLPPTANIVIDNSIYLDLHESRFPGDPVFPNADWSWKVEKDPEVLDQVLAQDWTNIEYIALSHEMLKQMKDDTFGFIKKAFDNSYLVAEWKDGSISYFDIPNYISTNGDWMSVYKVRTKERIILESSWEYYKSHFIHDGRVFDPSTNRATSEGQSYALLRAVWLNDRPTFDLVWSWTRDHLQTRTQDQLISWLWAPKDGTFQVADSGSAADADQDIALALLFASQVWRDDQYLQAALPIITDIWNHEVVNLNGRYYLTLGSGGQRPEGYLVNPSYLSPAAYRLFAQVDPGHPWNQLAEDSYTLLNQLTEPTEFNTTGLPPNWILVASDTGEPLSAAAHFESYPDHYGFDAFRTFWRVALDAQWHHHSSAISYLKQVEPFFIQKWQTDQRFYAIYNLSGGTPAVDYSSLATETAPLSIFTITNPPLARTLYYQLINSRYQLDEGFWGDSGNYYDQNWAWFATALYTDNLPNLWNNLNSPPTL